MTLENMIQDVITDTQLSDYTAIISKLNAAQDWAANRILTENENLLKVDDDQYTLPGETSTLDLASVVSTGILYQLKWLGVKLPGWQRFVAVHWIDSSAPAFISTDQNEAAASPPVLATSVNFNRVRFAPPLPAGAVIRADYIYKPAEMSLSQQVTCQLPEVFHRTIVSKALSYAMRTIDDDRERSYSAEAMDNFYGAMNVLRNRQLQQPFRVRPSSGRRVRRIG